MRVFCAGRDAREDVGALGPLSESGIGEAVDVGSEHGALPREADPFADVSGDQVVIASQDLHRDPLALQLGDDFTRVIAGRICECDESSQDEISFIILRERRLSRERR